MNCSCGFSKKNTPKHLRRKARAVLDELVDRTLNDRGNQLAQWKGQVLVQAAAQYVRLAEQLEAADSVEDAS